MIENASAWVLILSFAWLLYRTLQLYSTPFTVLLRHLAIDIPSTPRVTLDAITSDSVTLHWAPAEPCARKHIIQMDGTDVGVSVRGETSVTVSGLHADYLYSIQVIAVNAQGFQVSSALAYVRTRASSDEEVEEEEVEACEPVWYPHTPPPELTYPSQKFLRRKPSTDALSNVTTDNQTTVGDTDRDKESSKAIEELTARKDIIVRDIAEHETMLLTLSESFTGEEAVLLARLEELKFKKREEDEARSQKESLHKTLDQQKRETEVKRNQVQKSLRQVQEDYRKQCSDIAAFTSGITNSIDTIEHLRLSLTTMKAETTEAIGDSQRAGCIATAELVEIEAEIRYLLQRKAESEKELAGLLDQSRIPAPPAQKAEEIRLEDAIWREREEGLAKRYEVTSKAMAIAQEAVEDYEKDRYLLGSNPGLSSVRRRQSRRVEVHNISFEEAIPYRERTGSEGKAVALPSFNPDAAPFVASTPSSVSSFGHTQHGQTHMQSTLQHQGTLGTYSGFPHPFAAPHHEHQSSIPTTSVFEESSLAGRGSPISSHSGSSPSSPGAHIMNTLPSMFYPAHTSTHLHPDYQASHSNSQPPGQSQSRNVPGSLISSLNGTMILENHVSNTGLTPSSSDILPLPNNISERSRWFWTKKKPSDPLALNRKNTRSLPKSGLEVAPIGTRRGRSGSLHEDHDQTSTGRPTSRGALDAYHDLDLISTSPPRAIALSRVTSTTSHDRDRDGYSTSASPLPMPTINGGAFGWEPASVQNRRGVVDNTWTLPLQSRASSTGFDPFGDLPSTSQPTLAGSLALGVGPTFGGVGPSTLTSVIGRNEIGADSDFDTASISTSAFEELGLGRQMTSDSRLSKLSKADDAGLSASSSPSESPVQKDKEKRRKMASGVKFASFVGRVLGKKEGQAQVQAQEKEIHDDGDMEKAQIEGDGVGIAM